MKRIWIIGLWIGFTLLCNPIQAQVINKPIVVLDPGHGGVDSEAISINGVLEKDIVLEVGKETIRLSRELFGNSLDIQLTRYKDILFSFDL
ncbi:N-acetylmuramoyl-L-alanine amidase [Arenibacter sp. M-2]|uniref:N-acetylmuramoyl-L-alanine amidase family protein n=1 Tax=Arenibacter sp. M-2 TaxID=3053612 RepID=UPI002570293D|nr:N-acetylmuramoyl-L-alanine amidase [Arenibacter sp. M-2]MDL5512539.1 N-acetylmuramoyl-L-alanine amidase [Arenibacter sp. M-2]